MTETPPSSLLTEPLCRFLITLEALPDFVIAHQRGPRLLAAAGAGAPAERRCSDPLLTMLQRDGPAAVAAAVAQKLSLAAAGEVTADDWRRLATLEFLAARLDPAVAAASRALTAAPPGRAADWRLLGLIRYAQGRWTDGQAAYRNGLAIAPAEAELWRNLARAHRAAGELDVSDHLLDICLSLQPDHGEACANRLMTLRARGVPDDERNYALSLLQEPGRGLPALAAALTSLLFLGEREALLRGLGRLLAYYPADALALRTAAEILPELGDPTLTRRWAERLQWVAATVEEWLSIAAALTQIAPAQALAAARNACALSADPDALTAVRDLEAATGAVPAPAPAPRRPAVTTGPCRLRGRSYREFFADSPALTAAAAGPPPPNAAEILARMDPSVRPTSAFELARDAALWRNGFFVAGPTDFNVLVTQDGPPGQGGRTMAHIISADSYVNHRISQIPSRQSPTTRALIASPVLGLEQPDWLVDPSSLPVEEVEGGVFIGGHENYGHFLWEILSRVMAARHFPHLRALPLHVLIHAPYQREALAMAAGGAPLREIAAFPRLIRFRRSYAPRDLSYWAAIRHVRAALLRACGLATDSGKVGPLSETPSRLFLSRASYWPQRHRIADEALFDDLLAQRGVASMQVDRLSMPATIRLFAAARLIVGATGAQFANLPFCQPDARVLDLAAGYQAIRPVWHWSLPLVFGYAQCLHRRLYGRDTFIEPGTALNWITRYDPAAVAAALDALTREDLPPLTVPPDLTDDPPCFFTTNDAS